MSVALLLAVLTSMPLAVGAALLSLFAGAALHCFRQAAAAFGDLPPHDDGT